MIIQTSRFGNVEIEVDDVLSFPNGILGYSEYRRWVILADSDNPAVAWLQSLDRVDLAMAVVSPRRFVKDYQIRVTQKQMAPLLLSAPEHAFNLCIVSRHEQSLTVNLRAPIIVNLERGIGMQVVTADEQPTQYELVDLTMQLRRSA